MNTEGNIGAPLEESKLPEHYEMQLKQWGEDLVAKAIERDRTGAECDQIEKLAQAVMEVAREGYTPETGEWTQSLFNRAVQRRAKYTSPEHMKLIAAVLDETPSAAEEIKAEPQSPETIGEEDFSTYETDPEHRAEIGETLTLVIDDKEEDWIFRGISGARAMFERKNDKSQIETYDLPVATLGGEVFSLHESPEGLILPHAVEPPSAIEAVAEVEEAVTLPVTPDVAPRLERKSSIQMILEAFKGGQDFSDQTFRDIIANKRATEGERDRAREVLRTRKEERSAQAPKPKVIPERFQTLIDRVRLAGFENVPEDVLKTIANDKRGEYSADDKQKANAALAKMVTVTTAVPPVPAPAAPASPIEASIESRNLLERVIAAQARGEEVPEHVLQGMLAGKTKERAWAEAELAKRNPEIPAAPRVIEEDLSKKKYPELNSDTEPKLQGVVVDLQDTYTPTAEEIERLTSKDGILSALNPSEYKHPTPTGAYNERLDSSVIDAWKSQDEERNRITLPAGTTAARMINTRAKVLGARGTEEIGRMEKESREEHPSMEMVKEIRPPEKIETAATTPAPEILDAGKPKAQSTEDQSVKVGPQLSTTQRFSYDATKGKGWGEGKGVAWTLPKAEVAAVAKQKLTPKEREALENAIPFGIEGYEDPTLLAGEEVMPSPSKEAMDAIGKELELLGVAGVGLLEVKHDDEGKGVQEAPKTEAPPIHDAVLKQFREKFGLQESSLEDIEALRGLSVGQQMLVLQNLEQLTLANITKEAKETQRAEWGGMSRFKRFTQSVLAFGMKPELRIAALEKELLAKSRGENADQEDATHRKATTLAYIESLAKVAALGPEVVVEEHGKLRINYVSPKDIFESLEDPKLKGEHGGEYMQAIEAFNRTATAFANLPQEWGFAKTDIVGKERALFDEKKLAYDTARAALLSVYKAKFTPEDPDGAEGKAMLAMNKLDERVTLNQLFNNHPDAETALQSIADESVFRRGFKEFWKAKGLFIAYGAAGRAATVAAAGALAVPTMGASLLGLGAVGAAGAGVGYGIGKEEGRRLMKEKRASGRMSQEDEREEISYEAVKRDAQGKAIINAEGKPEMIEQKRKIREFTDAAFFTDRMERLMSKLEKVTDPKERALLEIKIAQTTTLMASKLEHGMINWSGSGLDADDERKGASIANRLSFMQAMAKGAIAMTIDAEKLEAESERLVGLRESTIEDMRKKEIKHIVAKAAMTRAGFALAGAGIAQVAHFLYANGLPDPSKLLTHDEAEIAAGGGVIKETPQGAGVGGHEVISEARPPKVEGLIETRFVSKQIVDYSEHMNKVLNRPLSLIETNALWRTASENVGSPQYEAHGKLLGLLMSKRTPLTEAEISDVFKSVKFDPTTMGKPLPEEVAPGLGRNEEVIYDEPKVAKGPAYTKLQNPLTQETPAPTGETPPQEIVITPKATGGEDLLVSPEIEAYMPQIQKEFSRVISIDEAKALWRTEAHQPPVGTYDYAAKRLEAHDYLKAIMHERSTPLTQSDINKVFESIQFDPAKMGKPLAGELISE